MNRRKQNWIPLVSVLAAVLVLLIVVALVLSDGRKNHEPAQTAGETRPSTQSTGVQTEKPGDQTDLVIETPFCDLVYPGAWKEHLVVEQVAGTEHDVNFYAEFEGKERIFLFSITFSPEQDDAVAVIQDTAGNDVGVYFHMTEVTGDLSDAQLDEAYSMQEIANDLLEQLG